jgi:hypothetical protein
MNTQSRSIARRLAGGAAALTAGVALFGAGAAHAQFHHHYWGPRFGVYVGPGWYYPPPYYYPPPVVVQQQPPVYIERAPEVVTPAPAPSTAPAAPAQPQSYYFCPGSNAYYPYVRECAGGWQQVAPQPAR